MNNHNIVFFVICEFFETFSYILCFILCVFQRHTHAPVNMWKSERSVRCYFSSGTTFEVRSLCCSLLWAPEYLNGGTLGFSCLCLPSFLRNNGITGVHSCTWLYLGYEYSNTGYIASVVPTEPCPKSLLLLLLWTFWGYIYILLSAFFSLFTFFPFQFLHTTKKAPVLVVMCTYDLCFVSIKASCTYSSFQSVTEVWKQAAIPFLIHLFIWYTWEWGSKKVLAYSGRHWAPMCGVCRDGTWTWSVLYHTRLECHGI